MKVTLATKHRQPRPNRPEPCDHHTGLMFPAGGASAWCNGVKLYNIFLPGVGTESFHLCDDAAEELRKER